MYIPALDTEEKRRAVEAEDLVLNALCDDDDTIGTMRYRLLGECGQCGGNDRVHFLIDESDALADPWCAEDVVRHQERLTLPILCALLRRLGVDIDTFAPR